MSVNYHELLEAFLYKKKLNETKLLNVINKFSVTTIKNIMNDLDMSLTEVNNDFYIFSDGNCKSNGKKYAKAGYSVFFTDDKGSEFYNLNKTELITSEPTNNKAELSGIKYIYKTILENQELFKNKRNIICTDSLYSINCIDKWSKNWKKNGWKNSKGEEVKNKNLIQEILNMRDMIDDKIKIKFKHILSHTKEPLNKNSLEWLLWYGNNRVDTNINKLFI